jgi:preprotein translocase subunit SecE
MARLQRKKPSHLKKKKTEADLADTKKSIDTKSAVGALSTPKGKTLLSAKKRQPAGKTAALKQANWVHKSIQFLREVKIELKKVTWPTKKQTIGSTIVVLVLVFLVALFLGLVDISLTSLIRLILQ